MNIVNIHNDNNLIYLFLREPSGKRKVLLDRSFKPYYFAESSSGTYWSYSKRRLAKVTLDNANDLYKRCAYTTYERDVPYCKKYIIDKQIEFDPCRFHYCFIDIELLTDAIIEEQAVESADYPISCITIYSSFLETYKTFFLLDYHGGLEAQEIQLTKDFISYLNQIQPDLLLGWNFLEFDYKYMLKRIPNFDGLIGFQNKSRYVRKDLSYPLGIAVVAYMGLYRKVYPRHQSYALDAILHDVFGQGKTNETVNFSILSHKIKERNIEDVKRLVELESKCQLLTYYDNIRQVSKCSWEDLPAETFFEDGKMQVRSNNSKIVDMIFLNEARKMNIILPDKVAKEEVEYEGAAREARRIGRFENVTQYDLAGAYPQIIIDFCLDSQNITDKNPILNDYGFIQNENALLPATTAKLLALKNKYKAEGGTKYAAIKGICNSVYGVLGNRYFRLFDPRVASAITFLIRDLLLYVINELDNLGYSVIYYDTDGILIDSPDNLTVLLNTLIQKWGIKYNKTKLNIRFDYEGKYTKIFIQALCRYIGYLEKDGKIEKKVKGSEIMRKDSSIFMVDFLQRLMEDILNNKSYNEICDYIAQSKKVLKLTKLTDIAFKVKMAKKYTKNTPIFVRALQNTQKILPDFIKHTGETYYYIYVKSKKKADNVLAFDESRFYHIQDVDWDLMMERNINNKVESIFQALNWDIPNEGAA